MQLLFKNSDLKKLLEKLHIRKYTNLLVNLHHISVLLQIICKIKLLILEMYANIFIFTGHSN
jgi:hypothetical protein